MRGDHPKWKNDFPFSQGFVEWLEMRISPANWYSRPREIRGSVGPLGPAARFPSYPKYRKLFLRQKELRQVVENKCAGVPELA